MEWDWQRTKDRGKRKYEKKEKVNLRRILLWWPRTTRLGSLVLVVILVIWDNGKSHFSWKVFSRNIFKKNLYIIVFFLLRVHTIKNSCIFKKYLKKMVENYFVEPWASYSVKSRSILPCKSNCHQFLEKSKSPTHFKQNCDL